MLSFPVCDLMTQAQLIKPASLQLYREPFHYFTAAASLDQELISSLVTWLESEARWELVETEFYEQYELSWTEGRPPASASFLTSPTFLDAMRQEVGAIFDRSFAASVRWSVNKLSVGQRIRIHNDLLPSGETHRVILHLNREWSISRGGFLMLFNSTNPEDVHRVLMPLTGSIVGFEISEKSNHAVSKVLDGERFAVVYSLYAGNGH